MYSYEIEQLLKLKNYLISNKEYSEICKTSPQISHMKLNKETKEITIKTKDNYMFKLKIEKDYSKK